MKKQFTKSLVIVIFLQQCVFALNGMLGPNAEKVEDTPSPVQHFDEISGTEMKSSSPHLKYLGCYDTWKSQFSPYATTNFIGNLTLAQCERYCINNGGHSDIEIYVARGLFCGCTKWDTDDLVKLDDKFCNINCSTTDGQVRRSCGGNQANSLYCDPIKSENCRNYNNQDQEIESNSESESLKSEESMEQIEGLDFPFCFNCTNHLSCYTSSFNAISAYIPENTPSVCVEFCGNSVEYYNQRTNTMETREPMKYANVGWNSRGGFPVATCGCFDELPQHEILADSYCNKPCPAHPEEMCGGNAPFIFKMYET